MNYGFKFKLNLKVGTLQLFLFVAVLYYFLRFQFDADRLVLMLYSGLIAAMTGALILHFGFSKTLKLTLPLASLDKVILIFFLHSVALTVITYANSPSINTIFYSFKDYIFPVIVYAYCRIFMTKENWLAINKLLLIIFTLVSLIYCAEFIDRFLLHNGGFIYTEKIRELTLEKTNGTELSTSVLRGEIYNLVRMEGPLSHNNVTGLAMAIGVILSLAWQMKSPSLKYILFLAINACALLLAAPRTAIFALLLSSIFMLFYARKNKFISFSIRKITVFGLFVMLTGFLASQYFIDWSAFGQVYSLSGIGRTLVHLFSIPEIEVLLSSLVNPLAWAGAGFATPGVQGSFVDIVRSDDLFFIQLISMYGLFGVIQFICLGLCLGNIMKKSTLNTETILIVASMAGIILAMCISIIHTSAIIRPQLFPIFFVSIAAIGWYESEVVLQKGKSSNHLMNYLFR